MWICINLCRCTSKILHQELCLLNNWCYETILLQWITTSYFSWSIRSFSSVERASLLPLEQVVSNVCCARKSRAWPDRWLQSTVCRVPSQSIVLREAQRNHTAPKSSCSKSHLAQGQWVGTAGEHVREKIAAADNQKWTCAPQNPLVNPGNVAHEELGRQQLVP